LTARYKQHRGVLAFQRATTRLRTNAQRAARRAVVSARGQGLLLSLGGWVAEEAWQSEMDEAQRAVLARPVSEFAQTVLATAQARALKRGRQFNKLTPPELHRLRIAIKKMRYATDFFAALYPSRRTDAFRNALAQLQQALGNFNDAVVTASLVTHAGRDLRGVGIHEARGILLGWSAGIQDSGTSQLQRVWKQFRNAKPFWE
jgi:CHAD domain-containing protein